MSEPPVRLCRVCCVRSLPVELRMGLPSDGKRLVGRSVSKCFEDGNSYSGKVDRQERLCICDRSSSSLCPCRYDAKSGWYHVTYEDDDEEELTEKELVGILVEETDKRNRSEAAPPPTRLRHAQKRGPLASDEALQQACKPTQCSLGGCRGGRW